MDEVTRTGQIRSALVAAGADSSEIGSRTALISSTAVEFRRATGRAPHWAWWVPGRIEIFGKHTDYAGGQSLVAAVPRGFAVAAAPRTDGVVSARDARWSSAMDVHQDDRTRTFHGWSNYVAVVTRRLASNFPGASLGVDLVFASDLPRAAGLSSSSALVVGIGLALARRGALAARPEWDANIRDRLDLAGYFGAVENGLTFRDLAGASGVGTHGGSEDHTAILNSVSGQVRAFSYVPVAARGQAALPADWRFLIMTSGIEAAKAGAARERYNRASLGTRALMEIWRQHSGDTGARTLAEVVGPGINGESALRAAIRRHAHADFTADALERRLAHLVAENGRVLPALEAVRRADPVAIGDLAAASQEDAERLLGNQVPQTQALAAFARESGAFAASSFGAGFGGSVWALASADAASEVLERWRARYLAHTPESTNISGAIVRPGPPAVAIDLESDDDLSHMKS